MAIIKTLKLNTKKPSVSFEEDKEAFLEWYNKFIEDIEFCEDDDCGPIEEGSHWFDIVQGSHKKLRVLLGGISKTFEINLTDDESLCEVDLDNYPFVDLNYYLQDTQHGKSYYQTYGLDVNCLKNPTINKIKTSKHILTWARKNFKNEYPTKGWVERIESLIAGMGTAIEECKPKPGKYYATLHTGAINFALLGHYGPDDGSCFNNRCTHCSDKFALGGEENSFVLLIHTNPTVKFDLGSSTEQLLDHSVLARAWGFWNPADNTLNVCNYYPREKLTEASGLAICRGLAQQFLNTDLPVEMAENLIEITGDIYHNQDGPNWTFYTGEVPSFQEL